MKSGHFVWPMSFVPFFEAEGQLIRYSVEFPMQGEQQ